MQVGDFACARSAAGGFAKDSYIGVLSFEFFANLFKGNRKAACMKNDQLL
jgi:hypothetical protein